MPKVGTHVACLKKGVAPTGLGLGLYGGIDEYPFLHRYVAFQYIVFHNGKSTPNHSYLRITAGTTVYELSIHTNEFKFFAEGKVHD